MMSTTNCRKRRRAATVRCGHWFLLLVLAGPLGTPGPATAITIDEIKAAWKRRQDELPTLRLEWKESRFYQKGSFDGPFSGSGRSEPPEDVTVEFQRALLFDRGRIRITDAGKYLASTLEGERGFLDTNRTIAWNRTEARVLFERDETYDRGIVALGAQEAYRDAQFRPPLIACWPLRSRSGIGIDAYRIAEHIILDAQDIVVLEKAQRAGADGELWLQAEPPYLLIRTVSFAGTEPAKQTEIEYAHDPNRGWYPSGWKYVAFGEVGYSMAADATVTAVDFTPTIEESDFEIDFPVGTWVSDRTQAGAATQYIQRSDGNRRMILEEELRRGARYQDLAATDAGGGFRGAADRQTRSWYPWTIALAVIVLCLLAYAVRFNRRYRAQ